MPQLDLQTPVFYGLLDSLHCCIETGNEEEARLVMEQAADSMWAQTITEEQFAELLSDFNTRF